MSLEKLSSTLWRERELLESLLYRLEVEQMVLATGRTQWLARASREVEAVLESLREEALSRSVAADDAALELGLDPSPSLRSLADACDEPWRSILTDHRDSFVTVVAQITDMAHANRDLLTSSYRAARDTLATLSESAGTYTADGSTDTGDRRIRIIDRSI